MEIRFSLHLGTRAVGCGMWRPDRWSGRGKCAPDLVHKGTVSFKYLNLSFLFHLSLFPSFSSEFKMGTTFESQQVGCLWQGDYLLSVSVSGFINYLDKNDPSKPIRILTVGGHNISHYCSHCYPFSVLPPSLSLSLSPSLSLSHVFLPCFLLTLLFLVCLPV